MLRIIKDVGIKTLHVPPLLKIRLFNDYMRAAKEGDADSHFYLAYCYATGFGTESNAEKAVQW